MITTMKKIAIILSVIVSVSSCNVLDQVSPNDVAGSDVFKTKAGAEAALVACTIHCSSATTTVACFKT